MQKLEIEYLAPEKITPYANNTRTHSTEQIEQIRASIKEFGAVTPIGLHNGTIVYGHARFEAMKQLGFKEIPTLDLSHLTKAQMKAYVIADNKLAENAGWDETLLKIEFEGLQELDFDLDLLGFSDKEISAILDDDFFDEGLLDEEDISPPTKTTDGFVEFSVIMLEESKDLIYEAVEKARQKGAENIEEALITIASDYLRK